MAHSGLPGSGYSAMSELAFCTTKASGLYAIYRQRAVWLCEGAVDKPQRIVDVRLQHGAVRQAAARTS